MFSKPHFVVQHIIIHTSTRRFFSTASDAEAVRALTAIFNCPTSFGTIGKNADPIPPFCS